MSGIGRRDCFYYLSDSSKAVGFCKAYKVATETKDNKDLCTCVGSMISEVLPGLRDHMEIALRRIGVRSRFVYLPSDVKNGKYDIDLSDLPEIDWPSMLIIFGCCVLVLLKDHKDEASYKAFMSNCICELQRRTGYDPAKADWDVPFDFERSKSIRAMLGATSILRRVTMRQVMGTGKEIRESDFGLSSVCHYVTDMLSWSGMGEFKVMHEMLVKAKSPIFIDPRVSEEINNLKEACEAVIPHPYRRLFIHLASDADQLKVESSRFPTLIAVAQELKRGGDGSSDAGTSTPAANLTLVQALVKLHRTTPPLGPLRERKPKSETD